MNDLAQRRSRLRPASVFASLAGHLLVLLGLALLPRAIRDAEIAYIPVEVIQETGASGAAGGLAASPGMMGADAAQARSASASASAPAASAAAAPPEAAEPDAPLAAPPHPRAKPVVQSPPRPRPAARPSVRVAEPEQQTPPARPQQAPPALAGLTGGEEGDEGAAPPGAAAGAAEGSASGGRGAEGAGSGRFGEDEGPGDEYLEKLRRWLARHKKYPEEARRLKQEGTVSVSFVLARDGTVLEARIEASSGFPAIDEAVMDMLERASPVPPVPDAYPGARLEIVMPIRFSIGFFGRLF